MITAERLRTLLDYNPETGVFVWRVRSADKIHIGDVAGTRAAEYVRIRVDGKKYRAHRLAWLYMTGTWPRGDIDHRDCDAANNRWDNLREADDSKNKANSRRPKNNTSGHKGVHWHAQCQKWAASLRVKKKRLHLGLYSKIEDAAAAYLTAAREHFGEFARAA